MANINWLEENGNILIVDDILRNRILLRGILQGYRLIEVENQEQALEVLKTQNIDLALLDIMLPDSTGYELCKIIKSHDQWRAIQVIMVTSLNDVDSRVQALASGADDFISRPFHIHELLATVKSSLRAKQYYDQMESLDSILFMLAAVVEKKDKYTEGHLRRIAIYAEALAQLAGCSAREQSLIRYGAILHDIGKIGVSESILGKPGKLTDEEYEIMKEHTTIGAQIVANMKIGKELAGIIRGHHERWDGSGYPEGLRGEQIPIGARIVSICDVYDAITTARSYKPAFSHESAIAELQQNAGSQFDPNLVRIFTENICEIIKREIPPSS